MHASVSMAFAVTFDGDPYLHNGACPEAVICSLSELSTLGERLGNTYQTLLGQRTGAPAAQLKSDQRAWLASRNSDCDSSCIERD
jgi:uncharacterized protein YecT (DUF1311 family)